MGEVVEINIVSHEECKIDDMLQFISLQMKDRVVKKTIEIMDNWQYENVFEITSEENMEQFVGDKIVCITEMFTVGQAGINIDFLNSCYVYCIWFNRKNDLSDIEYVKLIKDFIKYIYGIQVIENILIGAIGKEVIFEYQNNIRKTIFASHNIDVWILDKYEYIDNSFEDYNIIKLKNYEKTKKQLYIVTKIFEEMGSLK